VRTQLEYLFSCSTFYALCTDIDSAGFPIYLNPYSLKVRQPAPFGDIMGVTDVVSCDRFFPTDCTLFAHGFLRLLANCVYNLN